MKNLIFLSFLLIFGNLQAQPKVVSREDFKNSALTTQQLAKDYPGIIPDGAGRQSFNESLVKIIKATVSKSAMTNYVLNYTAYVNESGKIDLLVYGIFGAKVTSDFLRANLSDNLPANLIGWELKESGGKKFKFSGMFSMGRPVTPRKVRSGDSLIGTLEAARTQVDTLRIKGLHLNQLELTEVPYDLIYRFPNLEVLDLHDNKLTTLNLDMARLPKLKNLDLRMNQIGHDKLKLTRNKSLKILNLHTNGLTDFPDAARSCKRLESLWLGGNKELALSNRSFRHLRSVNDLNLYGCDLATLPNGLRKLRRLQVLDLYYNQFTELPKSVTKLRKLSHLAVANNQLTALPARIDRLKRLQVLYAHHNHLSSLPERITRFKNLYLLDLGYNFYSVLPKEILAIKELRELDMSGNNLATFPAPLTELVHLEKLHLRGNPFLRQESEQAYLPYIKKLESHPTEVYY
ncbi:leucine-rich repeat domain-containing protein [Persicitalea sp.]|uniref:leucine-rich repeat domain-containing protein n=1 Tax=Persicitalea sp. TaxID=3100273 RepID=UPI0035944049